MGSRVEANAERTKKNRMRAQGASAEQKRKAG